MAEWQSANAESPSFVNFSVKPVDGRNFIDSLFSATLPMLSHITYHTPPVLTRIKVNFLRIGGNHGGLIVLKILTN